MGRFDSDERLPDDSKSGLGAALLGIRGSVANGARCWPRKAAAKIRFAVEWRFQGCRRMLRDLTAILLPLGQKAPEEVERAVVERRPGDVYLRVQPLPKVGLLQVEVCDGRRGLPCEDPELVAHLSMAGRAAFVHVNHSAGQALVHAFQGGAAGEGFAGAPGEAFAAKLRAAVGAGLDEIVAADDGSRFGIGVAASNTVALLRGTRLVVPEGSPTGLNSFAFHDRGAGLSAGAERLAWFAFDAAAVERRAAGTPARELAASLMAAPAGMFGPLESARGEVVERLGRLEETQTLEALIAGEHGMAVRALELCALEAARVFAGGDRLWFWDERVLPMFSLSAGDPVIEPSEVEDLDESPSILAAMVEVLPWAAPPAGEGSMLAGISDTELGPLGRWARPGEEYAGAIFRLRPERLLEEVRRLDGPSLTRAIERFERAWYRAARPGQPEGDAFDTWRRTKAEEGAADVERFLADWAELRFVLELAAANRLDVGLLFYEGG
jgi:hypothetical protein